MHWVALRTAHHPIGSVEKADRRNAYLEAWCSWGSSVLDVRPRAEWEQEEEARRAKAERKAAREREKASPGVSEEIRGMVDLLAFYAPES